jgi:hypothetical protein
VSPAVGSAGERGMGVIAPSAMSADRRAADGCGVAMTPSVRSTDDGWIVGRRDLE